ncbi:MAG: DUF2059 domain-containing protein [Pseudomonadota bacterium]
MAFMRTTLFKIAAICILATPVAAADRSKIEDFMEITGFDQSIYSLRTNAKDAPAMLGLDADDFGISWKHLADEIFAEDALKKDALDILEQTLADDVLDHAIAFYASDLGQRLVAAENASHFADDDLKRAEGQELAAGLMEQNSPQPQLFLDMSNAISSADQAIASYREVQVQFLLTAQAAGLVEAQYSEAELRSLLARNDDDIRDAIRENTISSSAYTYRGFSDQDMRDYLGALSTPQMQRVYELMNAIQYTLMSDRYQQMAVRMAELHPSQEL